MINITIDITPENEENAIIVSTISIIRTDETNENKEYKYKYGGSWKDKDGNLHYVNGEVWNKRENVIFVLANKIMENILPLG